MPEQKIEVQRRITTDVTVQVIADVPLQVLGSEDPEAVFAWVEENIPPEKLDGELPVQLERTVELTGVDNLSA